MRIRCGQMLTPGASDSTTTVATGSSITAASTATNTVHAGDVRCKRRHASRRAMGCDTTAVIFAIIFSNSATCSPEPARTVPESLAEQPDAVFGQHASRGSPSHGHHPVLAERDDHPRAAAGRAVDHQGRPVGFGQGPGQRQADAEPRIAYLAPPASPLSRLPAPAAARSCPAPCRRRRCATVRRAHRPRPPSPGPRAART